jgi:hypothetical protein
MQEIKDTSKTITFDDLRKSIEEMDGEEFIIEVPLGGEDNAGK